MQINARRIVAIGTGVWFVAFLVLVPFWGWLDRNDHRVWLWTCLAGTVLGVLGWSIMTRHRGLGRPTETSSTIFLILRRMRAPLIVLITIFAVSVLGLSLIPGFQRGPPGRDLTSRQLASHRREVRPHRPHV